MQSRDDRIKIGVIIGIVLLVVAILLRFRQTLLLLASDTYWSDAMQSKEAAGTILAAFVTGICVIIAASSTVAIYNFQQKHENLRGFLEWLAKFDAKFHDDARHSRTRESLARKRPWIRHQISMELIMDEVLAESEVIAPDLRHIETNPVLIRSERLDWPFLRDFTDYLYFFEQVLAFGEVFASEGSDRNAFTFVNHFGWFLRSLCGCWGHLDNDGKVLSSEDSQACQRLFIIYLASNRYRRLTQVALLFSAPALNREEGNDPFHHRINSILEDHTAGSGWTFNKLQKHWTPIVGKERGLTGH